MNQTFSDISKIRLGTALISLLLSVFAFYFNDIINRDGVMYMEMSQAYLEGGLLASAKIYNWPFFSIVIAHIHQITHLPLEISASVLNTLLFVLLIDVLVLLSHKILPNTRQLVIAALFFLCFQTLNEYRDFVIRDIGYWYFCSLTLYRFMRFLDLPTTRNGTLWQLTAITAVLFRVEGVVILLALPFYLFAIHPFKLAIKQELQLNYLFIIGILISIPLLLTQSDISMAFGKINQMTRYINPDLFLTKFNNMTAIIEDQILPKFSDEYSGLIFGSGLIIMLFYKLIKALSIGYVGIYLYGLRQKIHLHSRPYKHLIVYFLVLNLIILLVFIFSKYFISTRYALLAAISLLLLMLPTLCALLEKAWSSRNKPILLITGLILFVSLGDSMTSSNSKLYIKNVAIWASQNIPRNSTVLTDDEFIEYYFDSHQPAAQLTREKRISSYKKYDYLVVVDKLKNKELKTQLITMNIEPVFSIKNKRGDKATVYLIQTPP